MSFVSDFVLLQSELDDSLLVNQIGLNGTLLYAYEVPTDSDGDTLPYMIAVHRRVVIS